MTSAEAASLIGVGATAIKRWADSGALPCVRTAGGHRRFRRADVERILANGRTGDQWDEWLDLLTGGGDPYFVQARLLEERGRRGSWYAVAESLGDLLVEIGRRWESGRLSVLEEHFGSSLLQRALAAVSDTLPLAPTAPRALLAAVDSDEHTLGLSLVELTVREAGWRTEWAGSRTPVADIADRVRRGGLGMVALSASTWSADRASLAAAADAIGRAAQAAGVDLVLGGRGPWPDAPAYGARMTDFPALAAHATAVRARGTHA